MFTPTAETVKTSLQQAEAEQIKILAKKIRNTKHFRAILKDAKPSMRRGVYDLVAPLLTFDVAPFDQLMKAQLKKEAKHEGR